MTDMVRAEGVHKHFGRLPVLKGIDLTVPTGQVCVVIGPSGSGKSTFLRCLNHLEKVNSGRIWVDGQLIGYRQKGEKLYELHEKQVARQRRDIGMVSSWNPANHAMSYRIRSTHGRGSSLGGCRSPW